MNFMEFPIFRSLAGFCFKGFNQREKVKIDSGKHKGRKQDETAFFIRSQGD
jgi:hypothetical protein